MIDKAAVDADWSLERKREEMAAAGGMWPAAEVKNEARLGEDE